MNHRKRRKRLTTPQPRRLRGEQVEARLCLSAIGFIPHEIIASDTDGASDVKTFDIDDDGDLDLLCASSLDDKIAWYENMDGEGTFGQQHVITASADYALSVHAADLDGDGDLDVLSASSADDKVAWYENIDGEGTFGEQRIITTIAEHAFSVRTGDLDGDGDLDVLSASSGDKKVAWYQNTDGRGTFGDQHVITTNPEFAEKVQPGDIDGDGDLDLLLGSGWSENIDGAGTFGRPKVILAGGELADVDGDGDLDVFSGAYWSENTDGAGTFGPRQVLATPEDHVRSVFMADLDGDHDLDLVTASNVRDGEGPLRVGKIAWYENTDGLGQFGEPQTITTSVDSQLSVHQLSVHQLSVHTGDLDGDGDLDVVSASAGDDKIAWYENTDGKGTFGRQSVLSTTAASPKSVYAADLDGDGDLDALSATKYDDKIAWYENTDGRGRFSENHTITTITRDAASVHSGDLDGDGDQDILAFALDGKVAWYENTDGRGRFGRERVIVTTSNVGRSSSVYVGDMDGDRDLDVLSVAWCQGQVGCFNHVAWSENTDGKGSFGDLEVVALASPKLFELITLDRMVFPGDLDGDGDVDFLYADDEKITWRESRRIGDSNNDGIFNSADLIAVLQAGEYEDSFDGNSTFDEGDWNGDRDFDAADIVFALQAGTYVPAASPSLSQVESVIDGLFAHTRPLPSP